MTLVTRDIWQAIEMTELWREGLPPVAGGVLDQAAVAVVALRFILREIKGHEAEQKAKLYGAT